MRCPNCDSTNVRVLIIEMLDHTSFNTRCRDCHLTESLHIRKPVLSKPQRAIRRVGVPA